MKISPLILIGALVIVGTVSGQSKEVPTLSSTLRRTPRLMVKGSRVAVTTPTLHRHWIATTLLVAGAALIDDDLQPHRDKLLPDPLANFGEAWGGRWAAITILPGIYLADKKLLDDHPSYAKRIQFALPALTSVAVVTLVMKEVVRRQRPNGASHRSFPSGHTSSSFATAEVVRYLYGNWAGLPFYAAAVITATSRIHDNKHYLSDVIAGAGLAIGLVRGFELTDVNGDARIDITVIPQPSGFDVAITW